MKLYQFNLPLYDNAGKSCERAHIDFKSACKMYAGGYTVQGTNAVGEWYCTDDGNTYKDEIVIYQVAVDAKGFKRILEEAFNSFPDQLAIFTAIVGEATIHARKG